MNASVADLTALASERIGPGDVGHSIWVVSAGAWYRAVLEGAGSDKWELSHIPGSTADRSGAYRRTVDCDDADIALAAHSAVVDFGAALPAGALVTGVVCELTEAWGDGGAGTFSADVGTQADDDLFTPTALDIDGATGLQTQSVAVPASAAQLKLTISGSVNLANATTGTMVLTVLWTVPSVIAV